MQHKIFCIREFIKTESETAVQRAFRLPFEHSASNEEGHLSLESPIWANRLSVSIFLYHAVLFLNRAILSKCVCFQHLTSNEEEHLSLESPIWANRLSVSTFLNHAVLFLNCASLSKCVCTTYFLVITLEDFETTEFDTAFSGRQLWLCRAISNTLKVETVSVPETVENFHNFTLLSAREDFIEFSLYF
jgi:hypothetical protein